MEKQYISVIQGVLYWLLFIITAMNTKLNARLLGDEQEEY